MAIPEAQLETWSAQGAVTQSKNTYASIKNLLESASSPFSAKAFSIFLQGSYGNDTNIYADSDVDIVVRLDSTFNYDDTQLTVAEKFGFDAAYPVEHYGFWDFRNHIHGWLVANYGGTVHPGKKAIWVAGNGYRRNADVLPCVSFRNYRHFNSMSDQGYAEGICFFTTDGSQIINYPRQHSDNLTRKHQQTNGWLKPTVRIVKNLRNRMIADGLINEGLAPSYYLEGMLYNVPSLLFGKSYKDTIENALSWLANTDRTKLVCPNEQYYLLRNASSGSWNPIHCEQFLANAINTWLNW